MGAITSLIRGFHTLREAATLQEAADRFSDRAIRKIESDVTAIRFVSEDELPKNWPLGASAINDLEPDGTNTIYFLRSKFNRGRAIHELFHAYDWKKTYVNGKLVWQSASESDPHVQALQANYKKNFEHDFLKNVVEVLKAQHVLPGAWYPVALRTMEAMHYPFLASGARELFHKSESASQSPLVYFLARYDDRGIEVSGIEPEEGATLQRVYQDYGNRTFEIPEWKKIAIEHTRQAKSYAIDSSSPDRRFSEYAFVNDAREYTAEGAKFLMDTPETKRALKRSDEGLFSYLQSLKIVKS